MTEPHEDPGSAPLRKDRLLREREGDGSSATARRVCMGAFGPVDLIPQALEV